MGFYRLVFIAALVATAAFAKADAGYRAVQIVPVAGGSIEILEDARLSPALAKTLWRTAVDPAFALGENDPRVQVFKAKPLRPARLRQVRSNGSVIVDVVPDRQAPIARVERRRLASASRPVFLVTTDNSVGFGSYSGNLTSLYALEQGTLRPVMALGDVGQAEAITLASTLKSGWKITAAHPDHTVIQQVFCRPDLESSKSDREPQFLLTYVTYWSQGGRWRVAKRTAPGYWESDDDWPAASEFVKPR